MKPIGGPDVGPDVEQTGAIGILFESGEWSDFALRDNIIAMGVPADLIDMQEDIDVEKLLSYRMIVSRVFASSVFRGHEKALRQMDTAIELFKNHRIPMLNIYEAHYYEISKSLQTTTLAEHGFPVPKVYGVYSTEELRQRAGVQPDQGHYAGNPQNPIHSDEGRPDQEQRGATLRGDRHGGVGQPMQTRLAYPCIVKPDCGGRTTFTYIIGSDEELLDAAETMPALRFIAEEFIPPEYGFITRVEVIGGACPLIVKRSVADNGLSAYHLGSAYQVYEDCPDAIQETAVSAMDLLKIEVGSLDIIENSQGFFIIDVNSVSNVSEDNTEMFGFDLMKETAAYAVRKYERLHG